MRRIPELDGLRGIGALSILVYHLQPQHYGPGWSRVDLFFVLSGHFLTTSLLAHGNDAASLKRFHLRRVARLWPGYFFALGLIVAINPFLPRPFPLNGLAYYATFTQNIPLYWSHEAPPFHWYFAHSWSLANLEQFYLLWPWLVRRAGRERLVALCLGTIAVSVGLRSAGFHPWLLAARCDGLALGSLLAIWVSPSAVAVFEPRRLTRGLGLLAAVGLIGMILAREIPGARLETNPVVGLRIAAACVFYTGLVGLVIQFSGHPAIRWLGRGPAEFLGRISYGMYLHHAIVFLAVVQLARRFGLEQDLRVEAAMLGAAIVVAILAHRVLEHPGRWVRERFHSALGGKSGPERKAPLAREPIETSIRLAEAA